MYGNVLTLQAAAHTSPGADCPARENAAMAVGRFVCPFFLNIYIYVYTYIKPFILLVHSSDPLIKGKWAQLPVMLASPH